MAFALAWPTKVLFSVILQALAFFTWSTWMLLWTSCSKSLSHPSSKSKNYPRTSNLPTRARPLSSWAEKTMSPKPCDSWTRRNTIANWTRTPHWSTPLSSSRRNEGPSLYWRRNLEVPYTTPCDNSIILLATQESQTLNPDRPIVSSCGAPTEKISKFVDHHLYPHVETFPSHLKDTTDFLLKLQSLPNNLPDDTLLVTLDVTSLYTNLPHSEGIEVCRQALDSQVSSNWQKTSWNWSNRFWQGTTLLSMINTTFKSILYSHGPLLC